MQRLGSLAVCAWRRSPACSLQRAVPGPGPGPGPGARGRRLLKRRLAVPGQTHAPFSSQPPGSPAPRRPQVSVVGIPDPITWIRCRVLMCLVELHFELDVNSAEFEKGVKQALVHVSNLMSSGRYHSLVGIVSKETIAYVETRCRSLSEAQRKQLAVTMDDIIFTLPEDVSVVFDKYGRKFCFVVMRFWLLSTYEGPDDPEGTKIFEVASGEDGGPRRRIVTAVYEFHRELTSGASPDWTVTTVWHWDWKLAE